MSTAVAYKSYAKVNLYLDVIAKREDGYHDIETVFQTVNLADELFFTEDLSRVSLTCSRPELDTTESNLVYRAAMLLKEKTGYSQGVRIHLEKHIPIAAGLAGGSGNAAATLVALNLLWELRLRPDALLELALELGSDTPYCMVGGTTAATGRGEKMDKLAEIPPTWFVMLHPPVAVSASRIYNSPLLQLSPEEPEHGKTPRFSQALDDLAQGDFGRMVFNRMKAPVFASHPHLAEAKQALMDSGCLAAAMSGSGPTLFGICKSRHAALSAADAIQGYRKSVVCSVPAGLERTQ